jgi:LysM repeat protein
MRKLTVTLLMFGLLVVPGVRAVSAHQTHAPAPVFYTVRAGDTLWSLANRLAPKGDPRAMVYDLMRLNRLDSAQIYSGERLQLPRHY